MKNTSIMITLVALLLLSDLVSFKKVKQTPQAIDLHNHYGESNIGSHFGPKDDPYSEYVESNKDIFTPFLKDGRKRIQEKLEFQPYPGYEKKLNPHIIKAGDMTNIAPSATNIIKPETASKLIIKQRT